MKSKNGDERQPGPKCGPEASKELLSPGWRSTSAAERPRLTGGGPLRARPPQFISKQTDAGGKEEYGKLKTNHDFKKKEKNNIIREHSDAEVKWC